MADDTWTVQDAKAQLSELLRRARAGEPQRIGVTDEACVVISAKTWEALHPSALGSWLVESAPAGEDIELPPRRSLRPDPLRGRQQPSVMTSVLLDTNVLSELVRPKPNPKVQAFVRAQTDPLISALTIHELVFGAERASDPARRAKLIAWIASIQNQFAGRIVGIDANVAEQAGRLRANAASQGANTDPIDALIASCAITRSAAIATRNVRDFAPLGVSLVDPWTTSLAMA